MRETNWASDLVQPKVMFNVLFGLDMVSNKIKVMWHFDLSRMPIDHGNIFLFFLFVSSNQNIQHISLKMKEQGKFVSRLQLRNTWNRNYKLLFFPFPTIEKKRSVYLSYKILSSEKSFCQSFWYLNWNQNLPIKRYDNYIKVAVYMHPSVCVIIWGYPSQKTSEVFGPNALYSLWLKMQHHASFKKQKSRSHIYSFMSCISCKSMIWFFLIESI